MEIILKPLNQDNALKLYERHFPEIKRGIEDILHYFEERLGFYSWNMGYYLSNGADPEDPAFQNLIFSAPYSFFMAMESVSQRPFILSKPEILMCVRYAARKLSPEVTDTFAWLKIPRNLLKSDPRNKTAIARELQRVYNILPFRGTNSPYTEKSRLYMARAVVAFAICSSIDSTNQIIYRSRGSWNSIILAKEDIETIFENLTADTYCNTCLLPTTQHPCIWCE